MSDKVRVQFDLTPGSVAELEVMMKKCGLRTKKDLLNNALTFLEWVVKKIEAGDIVVSEDKKSGKYKEIHMPWMSTLKKVRK